ncbi:MAG: Peptidase [Myxococcaceae bacterium]|nr:Peptidase [Myxococcaceae bacterium]
MTPPHMKVLAITLLTATAATAADSSFLREFAETRRYLAGRPASPKFSPDGKTVLFLRAKPKAPEQTLFELELSTGQTKELLTPEALLKGAAETLSVAEKARMERMRMTARGFTRFELSPDGKKILLGLSGRLYVVERSGGKVQELKTGKGAAVDAKFSPDGLRVGYVRENDVHVVELKSNVEKQVTKGGTEARPHGLAEFIAQEEMSRFAGFWFSADSKTIVFQETDHAGMEQFGIPDPMHPEARLEQFFYPRPGKANAKVKLLMTPVGGGKVTAIVWDSAAFPYLATVKAPKAGPITLVVQNREQTKEQVLQADPKTGKTKVLLTEDDAAWLNLAQEFPHWLPDGSGFFWMTEKNGGPEVELRNANGTFHSTWVKAADRYGAAARPEGGFSDLVGYDEANKALWFLGGRTPVETHVYRVKAGGAPERVRLFAEDNSNEAAVLSPDGKAVLARLTSLTKMPTLAVFSAEGKQLAELPSVAIEPSLKVRAEVKKLGGEPGFWTTILTPASFKAGQKLPVILNVYGGPGHQEVLYTLRENLVLQWLADQGFLVVKFDGRGTPNRGRDWERAIKFDFASIPADDQVAALKLLGKEVPEADLSRVGVYGWSFGGYLAALLAMRNPDAVKSAVSGAPVVDWLDYDTHYTERFLGVPPAAARAYEVSNLLTYVPKTQRPILFMHGTADDNVYFFHTLKLSDALFRAGKPHSVLPLANFTHMVPDPLVMERQWEWIARYFKETL